MFFPLGIYEMLEVALSSTIALRGECQVQVTLAFLFLGVVVCWFGVGLYRDGA